MTARGMYEAVLIELNKENAPNVLLEDFNYFANKAINQYINKRYNIYDINQQTTDDLRVLKATALLKPIKVNTYGAAGKAMEATFSVIMPSDYLHILNCICIYHVERTYKCYNKGDIWRSPAKRLTADAYSQVLDNFWNRPTYKNPYYYIHNVNSNAGVPTDSYRIEAGINYEPVEGDPTVHNTPKNSSVNEVSSSQSLGTDISTIKYVNGRNYLIGNYVYQYSNGKFLAFQNTYEYEPIEFVQDDGKTTMTVNSQPAKTYLTEYKAQTNVENLDLTKVTESQIEIYNRYIRSHPVMYYHVATPTTPNSTNSRVIKIYTPISQETTAWNKNATWWTTPESTPTISQPLTLNGLELTGENDANGNSILRVDSDYNSNLQIPKSVNIGGFNVSNVERSAQVRYGNVSQVRLEIRYGTDIDVFRLTDVYVDYIKAPQHIRLTQEEVDHTEDFSQMLEFPDYVCQEIINELVHIIMENIVDQRLQTHPVVSQSIANPAQQQTEPVAQSAQ